MLESDLKERIDFERILGNVDLNAQFEQDRLKKNNIAEDNNGTT